MNLLKSLQKTQTQRAAQPVPGQAANLRKLLASKSGKAGATSGPAISNIQEQGALQEFNTAATEQQQSAQLNVNQQNQAVDQQNQQFAQQTQQVSQQELQNQAEFDRATEKIANSLDRLDNDIESKEGLDALNQALFARRLADKAYVAKLQRDGEIKRLNDRNAFALEAGKEAFQHQMGMFESGAAFQSAMMMDDQEYNKQLAKMDMARMDQIIASQREAANRTAQWQAGAEIFGAVIDAGSTAYNAGMFDSVDVPTETEFTDFMDKKEGITTPKQSSLPPEDPNNFDNFLDRKLNR